MTGSAHVLAGLRVVEISAFVAGPIAGATLASLGADVIRVEQLGGGIDAHRWPLHDGRSLYRAGLDRGKRSVAIDLRSDRGRELVHGLVRGGGAGGGIVLTNLPPRGWLSYEQLAASRADLIMVVIGGSSDGRAAVDYTVNAAVGFPLVTGPEDSETPVNHVLPAWDVATGMLAATAVLAAERHRHSTGEGQLVELALADVATAVAAHLGLVAEARLVDEPRGRFGNFVYGTFGTDFPTGDGRRAIVCALTPRQWTSLGEATGLTAEFASLAERCSADFADEGARFEHRAQIAALLEPWFAERTLAQIGESFDPRGVLWGPYQTFKELAQSELPSDKWASPVAFGAFERQAVAGEPEIGGDTEAVLRDELGLTGPELAELAAQGVVDPAGRAD